jgi:hypothetical protein
MSVLLLFYFQSVKNPVLFARCVQIACGPNRQRLTPLQFTLPPLLKFINLCQHNPLMKRGAT